MAKIRAEKKIEIDICKYAEKKGMLHYKLECDERIGWPDRMFVTAYEVFFIEFKSEVGVLDKKQQSIISKILCRGIKVYIVRDTKSGKELIDKIITYNKNSNHTVSL